MKRDYRTDELLEQMNAIINEDNLDHRSLMMMRLLQILER